VLNLDGGNSAEVVFLLLDLSDGDCFAVKKLQLNGYGLQTVPDVLQKMKNMI